MNKKLSIGLVGLFAIALVSAVIYNYIDSVGVDTTVSEALSVSTVAVSLTGYPGETLTENIVVDNLASVDLEVGISFIEESNEFVLDGLTGVCMDYYPAEGWQDNCERRIVLDGMLLSAFNTMSWDTNILEGYVSHVDLILDNGESLTFEYATFTETCNAPATYPTGEYEFSINETSYAWESIPGPCGDVDFEAQHNTLTQWKVTYPTAIISRIEIEVDNWIEQSNAEISNIVINDVEIEGVSYTLDTTTYTIPSGGITMPVEFTIDGSSPIGQFTGNLNIVRI